MAEAADDSTLTTNDGNQSVGSEAGSREPVVSRRQDFGKKRKRSCLKRVADRINWFMESVFYRLGKLVGTHPKKTIFLSILTCALCAIGLIKFKELFEYRELWIPRDSPWHKKADWVEENFPEDIRISSAIVQADNVLTPATVNAIYDLYKATTQISVGNVTFHDLCVRAGPICRVSSFLELWAYNETVIRSLTQADIVRAVNSGIERSPIYQTKLNLKRMFGDVQCNIVGDTVSVSATKLVWLLVKNSETEAVAKEWELHFINYLQSGPPGLPHLYLFAERSFQDATRGTVESDFTLLFIGMTLVLLFNFCAIGKFSLLEQKIWLSVSGMTALVWAGLATYGLGSAFGIECMDINRMLPFLMLGIGVDDMFVIVESLNNLSEKERAEPVNERIGLTLKRAGCSIAVTSLTDMVAFAIGGTTVVPSMSNFCLYASISIVTIFLLSITYFVAFMAIDQQRIESGRDACIPCFRHKAYKPNQYHDIRIGKMIFCKYYGPFLMKLPVKVVVILLTLFMSAVNLWSLTEMKAESDFFDYFGYGSYARDFFLTDRKYFPSDGTFAYVYCDEMDYAANSAKLMEMYDSIIRNPTVHQETVDFWMVAYRDWLAQSHGTNSTKYKDGFPPTEDEFNSLLQKFLVTNNGMAYYRNIKFTNDTHRHIKGSFMTFRHVKQQVTVKRIKHTDEVIQFVDKMSENMTGRCFAYSGMFYFHNETNRITMRELYRNLILAAVCVFFITLLMIADLRTSCLVFTCVVFTLINVIGTLQFWGSYIDAVTVVILVMSLGLAVDYSAHVGHSFMTVHGNRNERAIATLGKIGTAVFNGGFSTFLVFILLSGSKSFFFAVFFRIFIMVVLFGLFHGLVYLPVILSWIGPDPYENVESQSTTGEIIAEGTNQSITFIGGNIESGATTSNQSNGYINHRGGASGKSESPVKTIQPSLSKTPLLQDQREPAYDDDYQYIPEDVWEIRN